MKLLILGATGRTGLHLVEQGLAKGHQITAFVRNPSRLSIKHGNLSVVAGDIHKIETLWSAIGGHDAVISALGEDPHLSEGVKNIISVMKEKNVERLLFTSSFGVSEHIFLPEKLFIRTFLWKLFADIPAQEKLIQESGLRWTIVRPARLTNGPRTGNYKVGENLHIGISSRISRADVADFLLKSVTDAGTVRKILTIVSS